MQLIPFLKKQLLKPDPFPTYFFTRWDLLLAIVLGVFAIAFYTMNLTPSISAGDNGELTTAMHFLGIAHAPGYPLHSLIGKLITLLPIKNVAWRANFFSAVCGGITVTFAALVYLRLLSMASFKKTFAYASVFLTAMAFMLSDTLWSQSTFCEVYTIGALFHPAMILVLLKWYDAVRTQNPTSPYPYFGERYLLLYAFLFGVAMCAHQTVIMTEVFAASIISYGLIKHVITPRQISPQAVFKGLNHLAFVFLVLLIAWVFYYKNIMSLKTNLYFDNYSHTKTGLGVFCVLNALLLMYYFLFRYFATDAVNPHNSLQKFSFLTVKLFFFLYLGFAINLYMFIRSHGNPPINWMGINETENLWEKFAKLFNAIHRKQFGNSGKVPHNLHNFFLQIKVLITRIHGDQYTLAFYLTGLVGLVAMFKKLKLWFFLTLIMIISYNLQLTYFLSFGFDDRAIFFVKVFFLFSYFAISIPMAFGIAYLMELGAKLFERFVSTQKGSPPQPEKTP